MAGLPVVGEASGQLTELPGAVAILAPDGRILEWNRAAAALMGWRDGDRPRLGTERAPWLQRLVGRVLTRGSGRVTLSRSRRPGERSILELRASTHGDRNLLIAMRLRTKHVRSTRAGASEGQHFLKFLDQLSDVVRDHAMLVVDSNGRVASWNAGAERLIGYTADQVAGVLVTMFFTPDPGDPGTLLGDVARKGRKELETRVRRREGSQFPAHVTFAPLSEDGRQHSAFAVVIRDLSEQQRAEETLRRSEEQLRHSQKMDAVGRLASGIAHDFNNVLTAIQGHVQFLLEDLPPDFASRDDAEEIRKAADRATELTRQLLTFARKQPSRPVSLSPNALISDIEKLLRRLIRADVSLDTTLGDVPNVMIDPGHLEQVIVNLVVNARDAVGSAGRVTITTSSLGLEEIYSARGLDLTPGDYVMISVSDTGDGISAETQLKIFEPFFTTKSEGTGLGLSTVYGIVTQAGGHVSVYSEPGHGTTFKVFLPVHGARLHPPPAAIDRGSDNATGRVLLVEDDEAVRALARRTLEGKGFAVVEASDGEEALGIVKGGDGIDVVVTDLAMPRLSGEELAACVRELRPGAGVVVMSGFPERSLVQEGRISEGGHFLEKPFTPSALVAVVKAAMPRRA